MFSSNLSTLGSNWSRICKKFLLSAPLHTNNTVLPLSILTSTFFSCSTSTIVHTWVCTCMVMVRAEIANLRLHVVIICIFIYNVRSYLKTAPWHSSVYPTLVFGIDIAIQLKVLGNAWHLLALIHTAGSQKVLRNRNMRIWVIHCSVSFMI
jgi:hypothetical protein